jgi:putative methionine-R-sulfoxide reductase with GAF domain
MATWIRQLFTPPVFENDDGKTRVVSLLNAMLLCLLAIGLVIPSIMALLDAKTRLFNLLALCTVVGVTLGLHHLLRRGHVQAASVLLLSVVLVLVTAPVYAFGGIRNLAVTGYFLLMLLAGLLLGGRGVAIFGLLSSLAILGAFFAEISDLITVPVRTSAERADLVILIMGLALTVLPLRFAMRDIAQSFERARDNERALRERNRELQATRDALESQVADRTRDLAARSAELEEINYRLEEALQTSQRRASLLQASAQVTRALAQIRDLDRLLSQVTRLISKHFGFYHVGVFLIDKPSRYAVLRATNSQGGQRMLARQHKLRVASEGIVGHVTGTALPRVALDVGTDAVFFDNPDLPDTRSELAVPLRIGNEVIGALDVQSTKEAAFDEEDASVLTSLADQIAIAIENANLFQQSQQALTEAEEAYRRYLRQEWDSLLRTARDRREEHRRRDDRVEPTQHTDVPS